MLIKFLMKFRNACIKNGVNDVNFCWVKDKGKYEAEQYFQIYPRKLKRIPNSKYVAQMQIEYEKLNKKGRPVRSISEKDALKILRKAKADRKEDFSKRIGKSQIEEITTEFESLLPYFLKSIN